MNAITNQFARAALRYSILTAALMCAASGQTLINLGTQGRNVDFTGASFTRPVKTGAVFPNTCSVGDLFFNTVAPGGQNLYGCVAANSWALLGPSSLPDPGSNGIVVRSGANSTTSVAAPTGTLVGTTDAQTLTNKTITGASITGSSIDASEINTGTFSTAQMPAFSGDISTAAGSTAATLATVNSSPGVYGDASHALQLTVDAKGRVTAVSAVAVSSNGSSASAITAGSLTSISGSCTAGALYFATDQPVGQQLYTCSSANTWTQLNSVGPSGALSIVNGSLDIVTSVVPRLTAANTFSGVNTFTNGIQLQPTGSQPSCTSSVRGELWFQNNGSSKDALQLCVYNGSAFAWVSVY